MGQKVQDPCSRGFKLLIAKKSSHAATAAAFTVILAVCGILALSGCDGGPSDKGGSITGMAASKVKINNSSPDVSFSGNITVDEGGIADTNATANDLNGDSVLFFFSDPLNSAGKWQTRYDDAGIYDAYLTASDGKDTIKEDFTITVNDIYKPINLTLRIINFIDKEYNFTIQDSGYKLKGEIINRISVVKETANGMIELSTSADSYTFTTSPTENSTLSFKKYVENSSVLNIYLEGGINPVSSANISFKGDAFAFHPLFDIQMGKLCFDTAGADFNNESRKALFRCEWDFADSECRSLWKSVPHYEEGTRMCYNTTSFSAFALGETLTYYCGDGICDATEDCSSCPEDCGKCPEKAEPAPSGPSERGPRRIPPGAYTPSEAELPPEMHLIPLMDVMLKILPKYRTVYPGADLFSEILLYNLGETRRVDVEVVYSINDTSKRTVYKDSETLAVETSLSKIKQFKAPEKPGKFLLIAEAHYGNATARSTAMFTVTKKPVEEKPSPFAPYIQTYILLLILVITLMLMFLLLYEYREIKRIAKETRKIKSKDFARKGLVRKKKSGK